MGTVSGLALLSLTLGALSGCGSTPVPRLNSARDAATSSPLGPSYLLIPLPNDDDAILGRILPSLPEPGRALEEVARPNPCVKFLGDAKSSALSSTFEDAQELSAGAKASATLGTFGFGGDADHATHFMYKLNTEKRISRTDTTEYEECCAKKQCGYGYVSALIYGDGEYATGEETSVSASVDVLKFASASGTTQLKVLHKRKIKGYIAAVINITSKSPEKTEAAKKLTPFGAGFEVDVKDESDSEMVKSVVNKEKIEVESQGHDYFFKDGVGGKITENEFVRRFEKTTGSDELNDVVSRRNKGGIYSGAIATGVGLAAIGGMIPVLVKACHLDDNGGSVAGCDKDKNFNNKSGGYTAAFTTAIVGGVIGLYGAYALIVGLGSDTAYDGTETDHKLTEIDARVYVSQYNKALVKKTVKQLQKARARSGFVVPQTTITWQPFVNSGGAGVLGTF
ncbi:MAG: hypothetical protein ABJE95_21770 [Byssovorax sp.]